METGEIVDAGFAQGGGGAANVLGATDDEDGGMGGLVAEMGGEAQGLLAGVASLGQDAHAVGGHAAQGEFVEIDARGGGLVGAEGHGDEELGAGMEGGGFGAVVGAHESGLAGDAAAAHDEDVRGLAHGGGGALAEPFVGAPGEGAELKEERDEGEDAGSLQGQAHGAQQNVQSAFHGDRLAQAPTWRKHFRAVSLKNSPT